MGFFDKLTEKITVAGQAAVDKTKEVANIAKLKTEIFEEEQKIEKVYKEIGKLYVELHREDCEEAFAEKIAAIKASEEKIAECNQAIIDEKADNDVPEDTAEADTVVAEVVEETVAEEAVAEEAPAEE